MGHTSAAVDLTPFRLHRQTLAAALALLIVVLAGCGGTSGTPSPSPAPSSPSVAGVTAAPGSAGTSASVSPTAPAATLSPTSVPVTATPTQPMPTAAPTPAPTQAPTPNPTSSPTPTETPSPTPTETPKPTPTPTRHPTPTPTPTPGQGNSNWAGSYSVYRPHTYSVQRNDYTCVAASIQMMLNIIKGQHDRSRANQYTYWHYSQDHSRYPVTDNGADAQGWVAALEHWGAGSYTVDAAGSMQAALRHAATAMRLTGKPVGMIVWGAHGGHAWVMTGFASDADPKVTSDFTVTAVQAMGPLWPLGTIDGKPYDPGPRQWVELPELKAKFTAYHAPASPAWNGYWITVLP
jgi:hypothetical protein